MYRRLSAEDDLDKLIALLPANATGKKSYTLGPVTLRQVPARLVGCIAMRIILLARHYRP